MKNLLCSLTILLSFITTHAQWQQTSLVATDQVTCFAKTGPHLFAGTITNGVYLSLNNGLTWSAANTGLPAGSQVYTITILDTTVFACLSFGLYESVNYGKTWTSLTSKFPANSSISQMIVSEGTLYATDNGSQTGVYTSSDTGKTWTAANNGFPQSFGVGPIGANGKNLFANITDLSTYAPALYTSNNQGSSWTIDTLGMGYSSIYAYQAVGNKFIIATYGSPFYSIKNDTNWTPINSALSGHPPINSMATIGTTLFAGNASGLYSSTNYGNNWTALSGSGLPSSFHVLQISASEDTLYLSTTTNGVYISYNSGSTWSASRSGLPLQPVTNLTTSGENLLAGNFAQGSVFVSGSKAKTWSTDTLSEIISPLGNNYNIPSSFVNVGSELIAGTSNGIYLSSDHGLSWSQAINGLPSYPYVNCLAQGGGTVFAGLNSDQGIYISGDNGQTWAAFNIGLPSSFNPMSIGIQGNTLIAYGSYFTSATTFENALYSFNSNTGSWTLIPGWKSLNPYIISFAFIDTVTYAGTEYVVGDDVFKSTNNGTTWTTENNGISSPFPNQNNLLNIGSAMFDGNDGGVYLFNQYANSWTAENTGFPSSIQVNALAYDSTYLYAGTNQGLWQRPLTDFPLSIFNPQKQSALKIYPNPGTGKFTVQLLESNFSSTNSELKIFDIYGKEIVSEYFSGQQTAIDLSDKAKGVYILEIYTQNQQLSVEKIIVQ